MGKKLNKEEVERKIKDLLGEEYVMIGDYINCSTKVKMLHLRCNKEYEAMPKDMTKKYKPTKCPRCFGSKKKNMSQLTDEINKIFGKDKLIIKEPKIYTGNKMDLLMLCGECGGEFKSKPYRLTSNKNGCPYCYGNNTMSVIDAQKKFDSVNGEGKIEILEISKDRTMKIKVIECGHIYNNVQFSNLINIKKCRLCNGKFKYNRQEILEKFGSINPEYEIIDVGEYINSPAKLRHKKCGFIFTSYFYNYRDRNQRCPNCNGHKSIGEENILEILENNNISFERQVSLDELYLKNKLSIDFKINEVYLEYDGEFHFKKQYNSHDIDSSIQRDSLKNKFFYDKEIPFIRIPFIYKKNLECIVNKIIIKDYNYIRDNYPLVSINEKSFKKYLNRVLMKMDENPRG